MNLINKCTDKEIDLINQAGIIIENKDYSSDELKRIEREITEYIMNHSSKNGDIRKLSNEYSKVFEIINV